MHAYELIELAALVATHGPALVRGAEEIPEASVEQYWMAAKSRLDRWGRTLKTLSTAVSDREAPPRHATSLMVRSVLEEILTGEILTRVWTATMCAHDRQRGTDHVEPAARSVLIGHLEARHRVLTLLVRGPGIDAEQAVQLNRLRRRTERWTDMLVGRLAGFHDISEFAIDPQRAKDFADDLAFQASFEGGQHAWPLVTASLRAAFRQGLSPASPNADLNSQIAESILSTFPPGLFDSTGLLQSLWMLRISSVANDAEGMLDELLAEESAPRPRNADTALERLSDRFRRFRKSE
jgi:hypothetical protein